MEEGTRLRLQSVAERRRAKHLVGADGQRRGSRATIVAFNQGQRRHPGRRFDQVGRHFLRLKLKLSGYEFD